MAETISTLVAAAKKSKFSMINHLSIDGECISLLQLGNPLQPFLQMF